MNSYVTVALVIIAALFVVLILWAIWRPRTRLNNVVKTLRKDDREHSPFFFIPMAFLVIFGAYALVQAPEPSEGAMRNAAEIRINLDHECPPASADSTGVLSLTVTVQPDGVAQLIACSRMQKRPFRTHFVRAFAE